MRTAISRSGSGSLLVFTRKENECAQIIRGAVNDRHRALCLAAKPM